MKKTSHTVKEGALSTKVWRVTLHGKERWRYQAPGMKGPRTVGTLVEAKLKARAQLREVWCGRTSMDALPEPMRRELENLLEVATTPADLRACVEWAKSRNNSETVPEAVGRFLKEKEGHVSAPYLANLRRDLGAFAAKEKRTMADVQMQDMADFLAQRVGKAGPKRRKDVRTYLVNLFRWARKQGIVAPAEITEADKLPQIAVPDSEIRVLSVDECKTLLREVAPEFLVYVAASLFLGVRPEELAPIHGRVKARLGWEHIDWNNQCVRVPKAVGKGKRGRARMIPLNETARAWLEPLRKSTGPMVPKSPYESGELKRLGKLLDGGAWPPDCLRHTYATARNSMLRNLATLAEEMGNSVAMLHNHYHNPAPEEFGEAVFSLRPRYDRIR